MARTLILLGIVLVAVGVLYAAVPGLFGWFGRLPGDLRIGTKNGYVFVPFASMIVVSLLLTLVLNLFFRR